VVAGGGGVGAEVVVLVHGGCDVGVRAATSSQQ